MGDEIILALASVGSGVIGAFVTWWNERRKARSDERKLLMDQSGEIRRADVNLATVTQKQFLKRIGELEDKIDRHHDECEQKIAMAIEEAEEECDRRIEARLERYTRESLP